MVSFTKRLLLVAATAASLTTSLAQSSSATRTTSSTATTTSTQQGAATYTVKVGINHDFQPNTINAEVGDIIQFDFWPKNHSVVEAAYQHACIPRNYVEQGAPTFFSGMKASEINDPRPSWRLKVNTTDPTFFYCSAPGSCKTWGMVGVINPNDNFTLAEQLISQQNAAYQLSPGDPIPAEGEDPNQSATPSPNPSTDNNTGGSSLSAGAIAGIAIGGAAVLIIAVGLIWFCGRKGGIEKGYRRSKLGSTAPAPMMVDANYNGGYPPAQKSPLPPSSPYGTNSESWRQSLAPSHLSSHGMQSPHNSYMGSQPGYGQQPYGFAPQHTGQSSELGTPYDPPHSPPPPPQQPPAELAGTPHGTDTMHR